MVIVVGALVLVVLVLAHKSMPADPSTTVPAGNPVGVTLTTSTTPATGQSLAPDDSVPAYGATGSPSPYTGTGLPGASTSYINALYMQGNPLGFRFNAMQSSAKIKGTGLLDPLPDKGTRSKQLLTKDVLRGPGRKL